MEMAGEDKVFPLFSIRVETFFFFTDFHGYSLRVDGRKQHGRVLRSSSEDHQLRVSRIFVEKKR